MKELGGYNTQALQASQAYQQHFLLQQMQQQAFGLKGQDPDYQVYQAMYQAQEAWYRQSLQEEQKRQHDEKMIQEERKKQEEEKKKKDEAHSLLLERLKKEEETRQMEKQ